MKFEDLDQHEKNELLKFPAYVTLLAAHTDGHLNRREKMEAMKFSHIKTFTCNLLLSGFFKSAEKEFLKNVEEIDEHLPDNAVEREEIIKQRLADLEKILGRMDSDFVLLFNKSMKQFKDHVLKAQRNVLEYFLFPLPFEGISD